MSETRTCWASRPSNVLSFYQTNGPGAYTIVLQELTNCGGKGKRKASLTGTQMVV